MKRSLPLLIAMLCFPQIAWSTISLPYSTSFAGAGCTEGSNLYAMSSCDSLQPGGNKNGCALDSMLYTEANNPLGTGLGVRHFIDDGKNFQGGTYSAYFDGRQTEIWVRFYIKYPAGFVWSTLQEHKLLWISDSLPGSNPRVFSLTSGNRMRFWNQGNSDGNEVVYSIAEHGWNVLSDGNWHSLEVHLKYGTSGEEHAWMDGVQIISKTGIEMTNGAGGFGAVEFGTNADAPGNGACIGYDVDDITISNTGYIGPINSACTPDWQCSSWNACSNGQQTRSCTDSNNCGTGKPAQTQACTSCVSTTEICGNGIDEDCDGADLPCSGKLLFQENFEDTNFANRGWYDLTSGTLSTDHVAGSSKSLQCTYPSGGTSCNAPKRHLFTETDQIYVSYWVKYSSNWQGSNKAYHPHEFLILTDVDDQWIGPAYTHLTAYIEQNEGYPQLILQDGMNIDQSRINQDLSQITENRGVCGCNGVSTAEATSSIECYDNGDYWNGKSWRASQMYFSDSIGQYYKNDWHHVEAYFKLNTISGGKGQADGILKYWYDGNLIIDRSKIIMRTAQHPNMKFNQLLFGPWIGDGSPVQQTMWVDNLTVSTARIGQSAGPRCTDADIDSSNSISMNELSRYMQQWKQSTAISLSQLMEAIRSWKNGC